MSSTGETGRRRPAVPDLIYPHIRWEADEYARLQIQLNIYHDFIIMATFVAGQEERRFMVDPDELAAALVGISLTSGLLPPDCLFWSKVDGQERLGVYVAPRRWPVAIRDEAEAWRVPMPGLLFVGHDYRYSLWALPERPSQLDTPLYLAPLPNVYPEGVCRGTAPFPQAGSTTIWQAVDIFFSSRFNQDLAQRKSKAYPDNVLAQWRRLHEAEAEQYPLDDLVETNQTLRSVIDAA